MTEIDWSKAVWPTLIPEWIFQDALVLILGVITVVFILSHEKHPTPIVLELICFVMLYAAIYENLATVMGWYKFGRSIVMVFNVPITIPLMEYLMVYGGIRLGEAMVIPRWGIPIFVGAFGILYDFSLDPLACSEIYNTAEGRIGRWSWYPASYEEQLFGIPVYNYSGWFLLCGYATIVILVGRHWFGKSKNSYLVGLIYPPICFIGGLLMMCNPVSAFFLWLAPFFPKGHKVQWVTMGIMFALFGIVLLIWRGRMKKKLTYKGEYQIWLVYGVNHITNVIMAITGGHTHILYVTAPIAAFHLLLIALIFWRGSTVPVKKE